MNRRPFALLAPVILVIACGQADPAPTSAADAVAQAAIDASADSADQIDAVPLDAAPADVDVWAKGKTAIRGTAYKFGYEGGPVVGAVVRIVEAPELVTQTGADGIYTLNVPRGVAVTPYVQHADFMTMHLQTYTFADALGPQNVNFQMVPPIYYDAFSGALGIEPDPLRCQISSTANTKDVFGLERNAFYAYGAHGIPDVTVWAVPDLGPPVYFSKVTIPDTKLTETTADGGIVWGNVPPGVYTVQGKHATRSIVPFVATCTPGRFINAGPPWGLREVGP
jgi:hypothetical protein